MLDQNPDQNQEEEATLDHILDQGADPGHTKEQEEEEDPIPDPTQGQGQDRTEEERGHTLGHIQGQDLDQGHTKEEEDHTLDPIQDRGQGHPIITNDMVEADMVVVEAIIEEEAGPHCQTEKDMLETGMPHLKANVWVYLA